MSEDAVLQCRERMFNRRSSQSHRFGRGSLLHAIQCLPGGRGMLDSTAGPNLVSISVCRNQTILIVTGDSNRAPATAEDLHQTRTIRAKIIGAMRWLSTIVLRTS
jgi:hypothetical protein